MSLHLASASLARIGDLLVLVLPRSAEAKILEHAATGLEIHVVPRRSGADPAGAADVAA